MTILHTALLLISLAVLQFFHELPAAFGILLILWSFMLWYYVIDLYSHVLLLIQRHNHEHGHILPLPKRLLHQMQKKHHFQASMKTVHFWNGVLYILILLGALFLALSYTQNTVFRHYNIDLETENLITDLLKAQGTNRAELKTFSLIDRLMPLIFFIITGFSFLTTIMRSGMRRVNNGIYACLTLIFMLQVFLMIQTGSQFIHLEWVVRAITNADVALLLMGVLILFEFVKSFTKQQISTAVFITSIIVLFALGFFTFFEYGPTYPHALYYNGWILLAIGWGRQNKRTRKRILLRQV